MAYSATKWLLEKHAKTEKKTKILKPWKHKQSLADSGDKISSLIGFLRPDFRVFENMLSNYTRAIGFWKDNL